MTRKAHHFAFKICNFPFSCFFRMWVKVTMLLLLVHLSIGEIGVWVNRSRTRRQADSNDDNHWKDVGGIPISEEAVNAGGYATPQCEPITVPICSGAFYEYTRMPNILNHETQEEAGLEVGLLE